MTDNAGDIICGGCCLVLFSSLSSWCNTQPIGANGCCNRNQTAGCFGSCCNDSFDEDAFDAQVQKNMEETRDPDAPSTKAEQPPPTEGMTASGPPVAS